MTKREKSKAEEERLAAALRANLKRRKSQTREREQEPAKEPGQGEAKDPEQT